MSSGSPKKISRRECVVCKWKDDHPDKSKGPLLKPCQCPEDKGYYHYQCVAEIIMSSYDAPCRGCDQQYTDCRIERYRNQLYEFVCSSRAAQGLLALWIIAISIFAYLGRKQAGAVKMWLLTLLAIIISIFFALITRYLYRHWLKQIDSRIWFAHLTGPNITGEFNLTQSKKSGKKVLILIE